MGTDYFSRAGDGIPRVQADALKRLVRQDLHGYVDLLCERQECAICRRVCVPLRVIDDAWAPQRDAEGNWWTPVEPDGPDPRNPRAERGGPSTRTCVSHFGTYDPITGTFDCCGTDGPGCWRGFHSFAVLGHDDRRAVFPRSIFDKGLVRRYGAPREGHIFTQEELDVADPVLQDGYRRIKDIVYPEQALALQLYEQEVPRDAVAQARMAIGVYVFTLRPSRPRLL
jgi:hypothetical protein